ncbi:olfactory receptor 10C1-like [Petromyzon marinus]|uniref:Olfactory receptor n=1 Tax=Petromyzon marinus TaxID=7757 RepID=A0AAJ7U7D9_PETMA|nr:olfactory receptor 10C1-like [Petromyzon marinus]
MEAMENSNKTFILLGTFETSYGVRALAVSLLLLTFVVTVTANLLVMVIVAVSTDLHKPMYAFVCNLVVADLIGCSVSLPQQLHILLTGDNRIPRSSCTAQMFWINVFICMECLTLAIMSFDRYVAICHPLHYHAIVTGKRTLLAILTAWGLVTAALAPLTILVTSLTLKGDGRQMPGIFCDYSGFVRLSVGDTRVYETYILAVVVTLYALPLCVIGHTYARIIIECKRTRSSDFKHKAVHTLLTHFFLLSVFFGSLLIAVLVPRLVRDSQSVQARNIRCVAEFVSFILPIANVSIYFFRTKELRKVAKSRLKKMIPKAFSNLRLRKVWATVN